VPFVSSLDAAVFSEETRQHVLGLLDEGYSAADVAHIIGCSGRSMRRWMRFFEENGTVWQDPRLRNLHADAAIRNPHLTRAVLTLVEKEPAAFLCDHVDLLVALSLDFPASDHRYVSAATVYRVLRYHQYTRKKIERLYAESSFIAQCAFSVMIDEIPLRCLVHVTRRTRRGATCYAATGGRAGTCRACFGTAAHARSRERAQ